MPTTKQTQKWDAPDWTEFPAPYDGYVREAYRSCDLVLIRETLRDAMRYSGVKANTAKPVSPKTGANEGTQDRGNRRQLDQSGEPKPVATITSLNIYRIRKAMRPIGSR